MLLLHKTNTDSPAKEHLAELQYRSEVDRIRPFDNLSSVETESRSELNKKKRISPKYPESDPDFQPCGLQVSPICPKSLVHFRQHITG